MYLMYVTWGHHAIQLRENIVGESQATSSLALIQFLCTSTLVVVAAMYRKHNAFVLWLITLITHHATTHRVSGDAFSIYDFWQWDC